MLTTLMDISEAQTGAIRLARTRVRVGAIFDETVDLYADLADARGLSLTAAASEDVVLEADRNRLRQVLANLVDNAIKYTADGGRIHLRASRGNGTVEIRVEDTGIGIPAEELPRVWGSPLSRRSKPIREGAGARTQPRQGCRRGPRWDRRRDLDHRQGFGFTLRFPAAASDSLSGT
jgi:signal transduction histidine kinase